MQIRFCLTISSIRPLEKYVQPAGASLHRRDIRVRLSYFLPEEQEKICSMCHSETSSEDANWLDEG